MNSITQPNLEDAQALVKRAHIHFDEFNKHIAPNKLWKLVNVKDNLTDEWVYSIHLNQSLLISAKPIISDIATNLISALDNLVAAAAKANGSPRNRNLYFPFKSSNQDFRACLDENITLLGQNVCTILGDTHDQHRAELSHVAAVKEIANSGKHWELMISTASAHGIAISEPGFPQKIFQIPSDAFIIENEYEFYRGTERLPDAPMAVVTANVISELSPNLPSEPNTIFRCTFRFVEGMIAAVASA